MTHILIKLQSWTISHQQFWKYLHTLKQQKHHACKLVTLMHTKLCFPISREENMSLVFTLIRYHCGSISAETVKCKQNNQRMKYCINNTVNQAETLCHKISINQYWTQTTIKLWVSKWSSIMSLTQFCPNVTLSLCAHQHQSLSTSSSCWFALVVIRC